MSFDATEKYQSQIPALQLLVTLGFKPHTKGARKMASKYKDEGRVHCAVPAIYTEDSELDGVVKARIDSIASRDVLHSLLEKNG